MCTLVRLVSLSLLVLSTAISSPSQAQPLKSRIQEINRLIYIETELDSALTKCEELLDYANSFEPSERDRRRGDYRREFALSFASSHIDLIENYSDYDREPLRLFLAIRRETEHIDGWKRSTKESFKREGDGYREILSLYPYCRLAAFIHYLLGLHYESQAGSSLRYLGNADAYIEALRIYKKILRDYPSSIIPLHTKAAFTQKPGVMIAPAAQMRIAWLYESSCSRGINLHIQDEIEAYEAVVENYPGVLDAQGYRWDLSALVSLMNIYSGRPDYSEFIDTAKVKEICHRLLNDYPNQVYEVEDRYFGEIHPESYLRLVSIEPDEENTVTLCKKIIENFPNSRLGKSGSGATGFYFDRALRILIQKISDPGVAIQECRTIETSDLDIKIRGAAQIKIAQLYLKDLKDTTQAIIEFKKTIDEYGEVNLGGEHYTLGEGAQNVLNIIEPPEKEEGRPPIPVPPRHR